MPYGASLDDMAQREASYADRIFKGAKPADLPVKRASTFEMVINMETAPVPGDRYCRRVVSRRRAISGLQLRPTIGTNQLDIALPQFAILRFCAALAC